MTTYSSDLAVQLGLPGLALLLCLAALRWMFGPRKDTPSWPSTSLLAGATALLALWAFISRGAS